MSPFHRGTHQRDGECLQGYPGLGLPERVGKAGLALQRERGAASAPRRASSREGDTGWGGGREEPGDLQSLGTIQTF